MAISATTALAIGAGVSAAGSIAGGVMGANAQSKALGAAGAQVQEGIAGSMQLRQALEEWGRTFRDYTTEIAKPIMREAQAGPAESQAYRDASRLLDRSLAATGNTRSGAAVLGQRELAGAEADRRFDRMTTAAGLFGRLGAGTAEIESGLLRGEMGARGQQAEITAQQGAVEGSMLSGVFNTLGGLGGTLGGIYGAGMTGTAPQTQATASPLGGANMTPAVRRPWEAPAL